MKPAPQIFEPVTGSVANLQLRIGIAVLAILVILALVTLLSGGINIDIDMGHRLAPPSANHLLGTDSLGRDLLSCIVYGAGVSIVIAVTVVAISALLGGFLGLVSGYRGGLMDSVIMRLVDILMAFPGILLAIAMAAFFQPGLISLLLVLSLTGWVEYTRLVRSEILKYKQQNFIMVARSFNTSSPGIIFHHLRPLVMPLLIVQVSLGISSVILVESGLNFLGLGLDPMLPTLGRLLDSGREHMFHHAILIIAPGSVLFLLIISFNFIGEGIKKGFMKGPSA